MSRYTAIAGLSQSSNPPEYAPEFDANQMQRAAEELARADWLNMTEDARDYLTDNATSYVVDLCVGGDYAAAALHCARRDCIAYLAHMMDEDRITNYLREEA